jgi:RpiB/LacA/LacB family sugar-phosphate isomerase
MNKEKTIYIGSDHAGFNLKKKVKKLLIEEGYRVEDLGPYKYNPNDDYPDYAIKVCKKVLEDKSRGILICTTGQGMDKAANKFPGIYAEVCWSENTAKHAREHGNANILCLGAIPVGLKLAQKIVKIWLETPFIPAERHIRRINKIKALEKKFYKSR